ncbi:hypothetical protein [Flavobacterium silvaticum]|uniref:Uncharacterized protein n=1 Tax=Flavobacterium silvaticum TaxID=1852020 RepID=A0A972FMT0_9FLAO|nr:hypothetical protein [Flavobacterium silvaticum]NMH28562.1 hypothetical protein [Flavobacterium silvaticum]
MEIVANGSRKNYRRLRESLVERKKAIREAYENEKLLEWKVISWFRMQYRLVLVGFEIHGNDKNY